VRRVVDDGGHGHNQLDYVGPFFSSPNDRISPSLAREQRWLGPERNIKKIFEGWGETRELPIKRYGESTID